ncbi:CENP-S associating centromere protein X-domain-containing protein [Hypoxylon argillaceum]|nr:CENP-S associating centromere protein X-domain-containing protein [Hypoxylon argillaceum]KAI1151773.1 CENP-S associating centromere protein X-domain-containing protein [Nemania diffusa]
MASKQTSTGASRGSRGGARSGTKAPKAASSRSQTQASRPLQIGRSDNSDDDPFADDDISQRRRKDDINNDREEDEAERLEDDDDDVETKKTIPPELLTRILHEFFEKDGTRISKDANKAVAKYMDIFVREAIARTAVEKGSGFLEVEDLEKVAPQLLMDL